MFSDIINFGNLTNNSKMSLLRSSLLSLVVLLGSQATFAQSPDWSWARSAGSVSNDYSNAVCTDADGNVYITGTFQGSTITFGAHVLQNTSEGFLDIFVVKYDTQGNVVWAVSEGGAKDDYAYGICVDVLCNVFITGYFNSPSFAIGSSTLVNISTAINAPDVFVAKYDPSGVALWGRSGDPGPENESAFAYGIGSDAAGNVYISGYFSGGFDSSINFDGYTIQNYGSYSPDIFLVKYDNDGNVQWVNHIGGNEVDVSYDIYVDPNGNAYITGTFQNSATFGNTVLSPTHTASNDIFIAKYDASGNLIWAKYALVPFYLSYASGMGVTADLDGNVFSTGYYTYSVSFGNDTLANTGNRGMFLAKYDINGNALWGRSPGGTGLDYGSAVCTDSNGNVFVTGYFGSSYLNFGGHPALNANVGYNDVFVAGYDPDGNALWATSIGGPDNDYGMGIAASAEGDVYLTGYFGSYNINFAGHTLTNNGSFDTFLAKIPQAAFVSVETIEGQNDVLIYPNPAYDQINVVSEGLTEIQVYDIAARKVVERQFENRTAIDVTGFPSGLYVYELIRNGTVIKGKFIRE